MLGDILAIIAHAAAFDCHAIPHASNCRIEKIFRAIHLCALERIGAVTAVCFFSASLSSSAVAACSGSGVALLDGFDQASLCLLLFAGHSVNCGVCRRCSGFEFCRSCRQILLKSIDGLIETLSFNLIRIALRGEVFCCKPVSSCVRELMRKTYSSRVIACPFLSSTYGDSVHDVKLRIAVQRDRGNIPVHAARSVLRIGLVFKAIKTIRTFFTFARLRLNVS